MFAASSIANFKRDTRINKLACVSFIPKFAGERAASVCELRNRDTGRWPRSSTLDPGKFRHCARCLADLVEELQAVLASIRHIDVDGDLGEERVDIGAQRGDGLHGGGEVLARDRFLGLL